MRRLTARQRARAVAHAPSVSRWVILVVGLLALAIQSFIVQTHIHVPQTAGRAQSLSLITLAASAFADKPHAAGDNCTIGTPWDKFPINEDPSNCPLGQEMAHSGVFVASLAVLVALPVTMTISFIVFDETLPSVLAVSHVWHGRAPPQRS